MANGQVGSQVALRRIEGWAQKANVIPHKIIRAFLQLTDGNVNDSTRLENIRARCQDVRNFRCNFGKMMRDRMETFGRVFVLDEDRVSLVPEVKDRIRQYMEDFLR